MKTANTYRNWAQGADRAQLLTEFNRLMDEALAVKNGQATEVFIPIDGEHIFPSKPYWDQKQKRYVEHGSVA